MCVCVCGRERGRKSCGYVADFPRAKEESTRPGVVVLIDEDGVQPLDAKGRTLLADSIWLLSTGLGREHFGGWNPLTLIFALTFAHTHTHAPHASE